MSTPRGDAAFASLLAEHVIGTLSLPEKNGTMVIWSEVPLPTAIRQALAVRITAAGLTSELISGRETWPTEGGEWRAIDTLDSKGRKRRIHYNRGVIGRDGGGGEGIEFRWDGERWHSVQRFLRMI